MFQKHDHILTWRVAFDMLRPNGYGVCPLCWGFLPFIFDGILTRWKNDTCPLPIFFRR